MLIKNGLVAFSGEKELRKCDLLIKDGIITSISQNLDTETENVVDATGLYVFPGGIDPHVHFFDPGLTDKEDFYTGTSAAAAGGITTIIDMPCTSIPPVTNYQNLKSKLDIVKQKAVVDFGFYGGLSRQTFDAGFESDMESLAGHVMGYKVYAVSGMASYGSVDYFRLERVVKKANSLGYPVLLHTEDASYVYPATEYWQEHGQSVQDYYNSRPEIAEVLAAQAVTRLMNEINGDLHIVHIGTAEVAAMLSTSIVTGETCPQYLEFCLEDFIEQGPLLKIAPPIKPKHNIEKLWNLLADGTINFIASDHAPGTEAEKSGDNIWKNSSGIAGIETMLPYLFSEGYLKGRLSLKRFLEVMSENAAKRYDFYDRKGSIAVGKDADIILIDPNKKHTVSNSGLVSKAHATPFHNKVFQGEIVSTYVRGTKIYDNKKIVVKAGYGQFIRPLKGGFNER